ncbi:uncharacterized protein G2W53_016919 [Senna tora]|uniref:Uncharacterized protein n=1 Tax=Senna tora TaxID=362788 RepID=A0A834WJP5_9FABA|nr:uncharacterized protein G2W53_016919 [Senna tora]
MNKRKIEEHSTVSGKKSRYEIDGIKMQCSMKKNEENKVKRPPLKINGELKKKQISELSIIKEEEKEIKATDKSRLSTKPYLMNVKQRNPSIVPQVKKVINSTPINKRKIEVDSSVSYKKSRFDIDDNKKEEKKVEEEEKKKEKIEVTKKSEPRKKLCLKSKLKCPLSKTNEELKKKQIFGSSITENIKKEEKEEIKTTDKSGFSTKSYLMNLKHRLPPSLVVPQVKKVINSTTMIKRKIDVDSSMSQEKSKFEIDDNKKEEKKKVEEVEKKVDEIEVTNKSEPPKKLCLKIKLKLPPSKTINGEVQKKQISELTIVENKEKKLGEIKSIDKSDHLTESYPISSTPLVVQQINMKSKEYFLDTLLASQENMLDFGRKEKAEKLKKEREAARLSIENMKRTVFIDDNLRWGEEMERLMSA